MSTAVTSFNKRRGRIKMEEFLTEIEYNRLGELLDILCSSLSEEDQQSLKILKGKHLAPSIADQQIRDGRDLAIVLRRIAICDETKLDPVLKVLKCLRRYDLLRIAYCHERKAVKSDPLEEFLIQEALKANKEYSECRNSAETCCNTSVTNITSGKRPLDHCGHDTTTTTTCQEGGASCSSRKRRLTRTSRNGTPSSSSSSSSSSSDSYYSHSVSEPTSSATLSCSASEVNVGVRQRQTCDVRLRVWAEYCDHERILRENVFSNKNDHLERQLERFSQASSILHSRDLGYIVCDIKFSEITYLDAFWRDYLNGSLLEALKGVFITESLKQAVGNEPIKLLVSIDEEDYEEGRNILMNNVYVDHGREREVISGSSMLY